MSTKFPVSMKVRTKAGLLVEVTPDADLKIDVNDLTGEMSRQPGLYAYYAALAEESYRRAKRAKFRIHCLEEDLDKKYRAEGKVTETQLRNRINRHPQMRALYQKYIDEKRKSGILSVLKEALSQRKDMLQSIGANRRDRGQLDLATLKAKARR